MEAGLKILQTLAAPPDALHAKPHPRPSWIETDSKTGRSYLKLPVPEPEFVQRFGDALTGLLAEFRKPLARPKAPAPLRSAYFTKSTQGSNPYAADTGSSC